MKTSATYTSSLSIELLNSLNECSVQMKIPKNKIIETALVNYLEEIKRQAYIRSFQMANQDQEMIDLAEMGLEDYTDMLKTE